MRATVIHRPGSVISEDPDSELKIAEYIIYDDTQIEQGLEAIIRCATAELKERTGKKAREEIERE
ncbi:MAG: hypothetical protein ACW99G_23645 [Candidatus Thorarchaeota archaeon]